MEYESHFHELAKHATSILDTDYEGVHYFIRGLRLPFRMSTQSLIIVGRSFVEVSDHTQVIEAMHHEAQGVNSKRPGYQGSLCRIHSSSRFRSKSSHGSYLPCQPY